MESFNEDSAGLKMFREVWTGMLGAENVDKIIAECRKDANHTNFLYNDKDLRPEVYDEKHASSEVDEEGYFSSAED